MSCYVFMDNYYGQLFVVHNFNSSFEYEFNERSTDENYYFLIYFKWNIENIFYYKKVYSVKRMQTYIEKMIIEQFHVSRKNRFKKVFRVYEMVFILYS